MADASDSVLPDGVRLTCCPGDQPIELSIRAADSGELAWRIHDLIPLIQSGRLNLLIDAAMRDTAGDQHRPTKT